MARFKNNRKLAIALALMLIFLSAPAFWLVGEENGCSFGPRWEVLWADTYMDTPKPPPRFAPQWTPDGAHIVFSDLRGKYRNPRGDSGCIYAVKSDGSAFLWKRGGIEGVSPDISPDGSRIAYETLRPRPQFTWGPPMLDSVGTLELDKLDRRLLLGDGAVKSEWSPRWSPDGSRIAFLRYTNSREIDIFTMAADGSDRRLVVAHDSPEWPHDPYVIGRFSGTIIPVWSPDGQTLAFAVGEVELYGTARLSRDLYTLYTVRVNGEGLTRIFQANVDSQYVFPAPAWSPDGRKLAFSIIDLERDGTRIGKQYVIHRDGSGLREIAQIAYGGYHQPNVVMEWSPNGDEILVSSAQLIYSYAPPPWSVETSSDEMNDPHGIFIVRSDGSEVTSVAKGSNASWSPDGSRIAMLSKQWPDQEVGERLGILGQALYTMALDGTDLCMVARAAGSANDPLWIAANSPPSWPKRVWYALTPSASETEVKLC